MKIKYKLRKSQRAKRIRLTISNSAEIMLTVPVGVSEKTAKKFLVQNKQWIIKNLQKVEEGKNGGERLLSKGGREEYLKYKGAARRLVREKLRHFNEYYNFQYQRVAIRNQSTRWGSCSSQGNLNFNYRIVFLSEDLQDYLVVHELCHLEEMNHCRDFWQLMEKTIPEAKKRSKKLRRI